jgi:hypothetical protein
MHNRTVRTLACFLSLLSISLPGLAAPPRAQDTTPPPAAAPRVVYATLLGGAAGNFDGAYDIAVDVDGNTYVVGTTESSDFPTTAPLQQNLKGPSDAFVTKLGPDGSPIFSTFLGGSGFERATAIAVDSTGAIYVAGDTTSDDFPRKNAFQQTRGGSLGSDAFVMKLAPNGASIVYSTFLGGNSSEAVVDIALDADDTVYVAGTISAFGATNITFPLVNPVQESYGGGNTDGFISVIAPGGSGLLFSTFMDFGIQSPRPRAAEDRIAAISVNPTTGDIAVGGRVNFSENEPDVAFLGRFHPSDTPPAREKLEAPQAYYYWIQLLMSELDEDDLDTPTEFGIKFSLIWTIRFSVGDPSPRARRGQSDDLTDIVVFGDGLCHPTPPATTCDDPAVVATFDKDLKFKRATPVGALREFYFEAAAGDANGAIYVAGDIDSPHVTTINPVQANPGGRDDVIVCALAPESRQPAFVTYFGGDGLETPTSIAVDPQGNIYVTGIVSVATNFPATPGALQSTPKGRNDAFVVKISPVEFGPDFGLSTDPASLSVIKGQSGQIRIDVDRVGGFEGRVTVTAPNTKAIKVKLTPASASTTGASVTFNYKVKKKAPSGTHPLVFTGKDADGRERTVTLDLVIQ